jgi:predicted TIM-barrel fold metal-dependent hydrolase
MLKAELQLSPVSLMERDDLLNILGDNAFISVHEHMDQEDLVFPEGQRISYSQNWGDYTQQIDTSIINQIKPNTSVFASVFFSCPVYERFRSFESPKETRICQDIYSLSNRRVIENIGRAQAAFQAASSENIRLLPIPFLFIDPNTPATIFEKAYKDVLPYVGGLKWHPFAQKETPQSYVDSGYIDLAAERNLPTVIHCERPGGSGDLVALFETVSKYADNKKAAINIAHMGFFHEKLERFKDFEYSFVDCSPWSAMTISDPKFATVSARAEHLATHIERFKNRILWGTDSPFNWAIWPTGERYGATLGEEYDMLSLVKNEVGEEKINKIVSANPIRFLRGLAIS